MRAGPGARSVPKEAPMHCARKTVVVLAALALLGQAGCTNLVAPARHRKVDPARAYWFDYAADRRGATMVPRASDGSSGMVLCAEPAPDVALEHTSALLAKLELPETGSGSLQGEFASKVVQLAGRTQTVLLLREAMYRLCEQSFNGNLASDQVERLFEKVLQTTLLQSRADALSAAAELKADPDTQKDILNFIGD